MASEKLSPVLVAGLNKSRKLIRSGGTGKIFLACDADENIREELIALCGEYDVSLDMTKTKRELRELCEIEVDCAVCAVPKH